MASGLPATPSEPTPLDRLQRAVQGWVGPVAYALPILEVWLLSRMGDKGASALLVALQVGWVVCFVAVAVICGRRWRAPQPVAHGPGGPATAQAPRPVRAHTAAVPRGRTARTADDGRHTHKLAPASSARRTASRPKPRRRGEH